MKYFSLSGSMPLFLTIQNQTKVAEKSSHDMSSHPFLPQKNMYTYKYIFETRSHHIGFYVKVVVSLKEEEDFTILRKRMDLNRGKRTMNDEQGGPRRKQLKIHPK